jgi:hypothetical protein
VISDIDKLTDHEVEALLDDTELKCKIDAKTGDLVCATPADIARAIARLKHQTKKVIFEVTSETKK